MVLQSTFVSIQDFEAFIHHAENADKRFEYTNGRIIEVVSNNRSSEIGMFIGALILNFVLQHKLGRVTGADGGYVVAGNRYIPDAAFISIEKQPEPCTETYNPQAPDLAVEVLSPTDNARDVRIKIANYLSVDTTVWVIDPSNKQVEVYRPNQAVLVLNTEDTLTDNEHLNGFIIPIADIFAI